MIHISSKENKTYKLIQKLAMKKYRDKYSMYLVEGENLVEEAVKNGCKIVAVVFDQVRQSSTEFVEKSGLLQVSYTMDSSLFRQISETKTSQGIIAIVEKKYYKDEELEERLSDKNILILDRLQDPGNIGTLVRTADAAGYAMVVSVRGTVDFFSPKVVRAAAGSLFRMPLFTTENLSELRSLTKKFNKKMVATALENAVYYYETELKENIALIIGNEGNGISFELMEMAELKVKIPMMGNIESLNAGVAGGILMYESMRK